MGVASDIHSGLTGCWPRPESVSLGRVHSLRLGTGSVIGAFTICWQVTSGDNGADWGDGGAALDAELCRERNSVGVSPSDGKEKP